MRRYWHCFPYAVMASTRKVAILIQRTILLLLFGSAVNGQIFRMECRRDTLMKVTDRDKKLIGAVIAEVRVSSLPYCVKSCLNDSRCNSINHKRIEATPQGSNCELLSANRTSEGTALTDAFGWLHYEPVVQVSSRTFFKGFMNWPDSHTVLLMW